MSSGAQSLGKRLTEPWLQRSDGGKTNGSEISSQAGNSDILQRDVRWPGKRVRDSAGDFLWGDHFVARPFPFDVSPDVGVCCGGINVDHPDSAVAQFFAHTLRAAFERKLAHAIGAPVRKTRLRCDGKNVNDAGAGRHVRREVLHQHEWRSDINADGLLPFNRCDFAKGLYNCDARVVHEQIQRLLSNLIDEIGNTGRDSKVMDQANHPPTMVLYCRAHFRQSDCIASVEKQFNIRIREFLGDRAANSAAGAGDKIALHLLWQKG
jgi:hypothetical protein